MSYFVGAGDELIVFRRSRRRNCQVPSIGTAKLLHSVGPDNEIVVSCRSRHRIRRNFSDPTVNLLYLVGLNDQFAVFGRSGQRNTVHQELTFQHAVKLDRAPPTPSTLSTHLLALQIKSLAVQIIILISICSNLYGSC